MEPSEGAEPWPLPSDGDILPEVPSDEQLVAELAESPIFVDSLQTVQAPAPQSAQPVPPRQTVQPPDLPTVQSASPR